jgi:hypothetical protein
MVRLIVRGGYEQAVQMTITHKNHMAYGSYGFWPVVHFSAPYLSRRRLYLTVDELEQSTYYSIQYYSPLSSLCPLSKLD